MEVGTSVPRSLIRLDRRTTGSLAHRTLRQSYYVYSLHGNVQPESFQTIIDRRVGLICIWKMPL